MNDAFHIFKRAITRSPVLSFPDFSRLFVVGTDVSAVALSAFLLQRDDDHLLHPIHFASRMLTKAKRAYAACGLKTLDVFLALKDFLVHLLFEHCLLHSDHRALKYACQRQETHGRFARWIDLSAEYEIDAQYWQGNQNCVANFFSIAFTFIKIQSK